MKVTAAARSLTCIILAWGIFVIPRTAAPGTAGPERKPRPLDRPGHGPVYGPWNRDLEMHESKDGLRFVKRGIFVERGGVPDLARAKDGKLFAYFQWFPLDRPDDFDKIAVMVSEDGGETWSKPETISIAGMPDTIHRSFDPTVVVLDDGAFRLYFSSERGKRYGRRGDRAIFSAISKDGRSFTFEPGQRFGFDDREAFDCAVARLGDTWHLYCPVPGGDGRGRHAVSKDGLAFTQLPDVTIGGRRDWLGAAVAVEGGLRFYGSGGWVAFSKDGSTWTLYKSARSPGGDPGVAVTPDGRFLAVSTGPLRHDASPGPPLTRSGKEREPLLSAVK